MLITGDGALLPGVIEAKDYSVALQLWAAQVADGAYHHSEDLIAEADERRVLDRAWLAHAIRAAESRAAAPTADGTEGGHHHDGGRRSAGPGRLAPFTLALLSGRTATSRWSPTVQGDDDSPTLAELTGR